MLLDAFEAKKIADVVNAAEEKLMKERIKSHMEFICKIIREEASKGRYKTSINICIPDNEKKLVMHELCQLNYYVADWSGDEWLRIFWTRDKWEKK